MGFWLSLFGNTIVSSLFLGWARRETDAQIGKMQDAAFDTPGAQSPLPTPVLVGAGALVVGQIGVARTVWRLSGRQSLAVLLLGAIAAVLLELLRPSAN